ncbi:MAG: glutathione S-transferase family protein [Hyphomonadaceae bacterium]|nr:glutathione S-transferase family protein [Hyphomonadaceae bacterium]
MNAPFRLYGAELSPYSVKVRSYLRFKGLQFEWLERNAARQEEFARYAKIPLIPILVDADESVWQDSTPMIEALERMSPEPSIIPEDRAVAFIAALLEDYADEWLNKAMFHYRWTYPEDQDSAVARLVEKMFDGAPAPEGVEAAAKARMEGRLHYVGSTPENAPVIEGSFAYLLGALESVLQAQPYLLGGRPSIADFGFYGQFAQLLSDPTAGAMIRAQAPSIVAWVARMEAPRVEGPFATLTALKESLGAIMRQEVADAYLAWAAANANAVADDHARVTVEIAGVSFSQKPQRYAAKALAELKRKRAESAGEEALAALLSETGCDRVLLAAPTRADEAGPEEEDGAASDRDDE